MSPRRFVFMLLVVLGLSVAVPLFAQEIPLTPEATPEADAIATPEATPSGLANGAEVHAVITETIPFTPDLLQRLKVPYGFKINVVAQGLGNIRWIAITPDGTMFITRRDEGDVIALTDANKDGIADGPFKVVASGLPFLNGILFHNNQIYLATDTKVLVATWTGGTALGQIRTIVSDLPAGGQHPNRTLGFGPDNMLYVTIGSSCNSCRETNPENATILRMRPDGSGREIFASGLRNTIGFGWNPVTGELWGMDQGADFRGDDDPPEELNRLEADQNYGWPWCFNNQQPDLFLSYPPPGNLGRVVYCQRTVAPVLTYTAHSSSLGMVFYTADQFPTEYKNDAFIAMRGSWNRNPPSGYKVIRLHFDQSGKPTGFEDFLTGFLIPENLTNFGRVAGLVTAQDGSLLIAEDTNGVLYRVSYSAS